MKRESKTFLRSSGKRLKEIRDRLNFSKVQMASRLRVTDASYYKNENGDTFPGIDSLNVLRKEFGISMDWFIFNEGPMFYKEKGNDPELLKQAEPKKRLEETMPDVKELLDYMAGDSRLRYEVMLFFYNYKEKKESKVFPMDIYCH